MKTGPNGIVLAFAILCLATNGRGSLSELPAASVAKGPLQIHPTNPRYFTDGTRTAAGGWKAIYLTGSHTWANLQDVGLTNPPPAFDFPAYLDFLERHHH